jgi:fluoride exporter
MMTPLLLALLGGTGALARFLVDQAVASRAGRAFPFGTLGVNVLGALLLGLVVGATADEHALKLVGTGAIGAFTTFSTWAFESQRLGEAGQLRLGIANFTISLLAGLAAAELGRLLGSAL